MFIIAYYYYSHKKKRLIEPKNLNNREFTWNRVLMTIVS